MNRLLHVSSRLEARRALNLSVRFECMDPSPPTPPPLILEYSEPEITCSSTGPLAFLIVLVASWVTFSAGEHGVICAPIAQTICVALRTGQEVSLEL